MLLLAQRLEAAGIAEDPQVARAIAQLRRVLEKAGALQGEARQVRAGRLPTCLGACVAGLFSVGADALV